MNDVHVWRGNCLLALLGLALAAGCGAPKTTDNADAGSVATNPVGSVGGAVIDAATELPVVGAVVKAISAGKALTSMTDADGLFTVSGVPAGGFIVTVSAAGYASATLNGTLSGATGGVLVQNAIATLGPIGLVKTSGTFTVQLVDQDGNPVPMVTLVARPQLRWVDFENGAPRAVGDYEVTAVSGTDGTATFTGLPDFAQLGALGGLVGVDLVYVDVPPLMVTGSTTVYSYLGATFSFQVNHLGAAGTTVDQTVIRLAGPTTTLQVVASNVPFLRGATPFVAPSSSSVGAPGFIAALGPVTVEFNQSIDASTVRAQLLNEDGTVATTPMMATAVKNLLTLTPTSALTAAARYNLALHVDAATAAGQPMLSRELDVTVPLFVAPAAGATVRIINQAQLVPQAGVPPVVVTFSEPVGIGFGSTGAVSCLAFYEINAAAGLDNDPSTLYPGEYDGTKPTDMTCPNPGLDITALRPLEGLTAAGTIDSRLPITGFSRAWLLTYDLSGNPECKPGDTVSAGTCSPPKVGTQVRIKPSKTTALNTLKRADGVPVVDNDTALSFTIP